MPPRVLLDATPLARGHAARGIGMATRELIGALAAELPYDARPALLVTSRQPPVAGFTDIRVRWPRWPTHHVPDPWPALRLHDVLRAHTPGLFHATQPQLVPDPHVFPTVVTCYDLTPLHENVRNPLHRHAYSTYLQRLVRARRVIAISRATADDLTRMLGIEPRRIRVVHLGVPPAPPPAGAVPDGPYVLYANGIEPHKNPRLAVEAVARTRDVRLVMAGVWSDRRLRRLRAHAAACGAGGRVDWRGYVDAAELAALRAGAVAVLVPSRREGFGLPVLEAMAAGTPVLCADIPALREVSGDGGVLLDPDDADAWAAAIERLAADPAERAALAERGRAQAAGFSWERAARETVAVWREALAGD